MWPARRTGRPDPEPARGRSCCAVRGWRWACLPDRGGLARQGPARGDGAQHGAQRGVLPHFHPALAGRAGEIGGAGADLDDVGRPAFFHFVDPECALVDQTEDHVLAAFPAQREVERAPGGRRDELAIVVVEGQRKLVGLAPALFDQREFEQARIDPVGQIGAIVEGEAQARLVGRHGISPCA
jgi:hypothetical protein